jgi:hypothetical protein
MSESGVVYLFEDLSDLTVRTTYTFQVEVRDNRKTNLQQDTATVRVNVIPLAGPPTFQNRFIEIEIPITQAINSTFDSVIASDVDLRVCVLYSYDVFNTE